MLISLDLDRLIELPNPKKTTEVITRMLREWSMRNSDIDLLILLKAEHRETLEIEICDLLSSAGWKGKFQIRRWTPLPETRINRRYNRELKQQHAKWHGASAHIELSSWPEASTRQVLPIGILLMPNEWPPRKRDLFKIKINRANLLKRLECHEVVGICADNAVASITDLSLSNRVQTAELVDALKIRVDEKQVAKPSLAWVSPWPPQKTGIANYSATVVERLLDYYDITVVTDAKSIGEAGLPRNVKFRTTAWLKKNGGKFRRICYHIGNSPFHRSILECLDLWPGAVVLHETGLGDLMYSYESNLGGINRKWSTQLYRSHGYRPLAEALKDQAIPVKTIQSYSCSKTVVDRAVGVITHSDFARQQIQGYIADSHEQISRIVPMCTRKRSLIPREEARRILEISDNLFMACSFGMVGQAKLSVEIAEAWAHAINESDTDGRLVFVGANEVGAYGDQLETRLRKQDCDGLAEITGWINDELYELYLSAADLALQFRTISRGETSAAIYDVICAGVPTIINSHASMTEIEADHVVKTSEFPDTEEIKRAIMEAIGKRKRDENPMQRAVEELQIAHSPTACSNQYREHLEAIYASKKAIRNDVISTLALPVRRHSATLEDAIGLLETDFAIQQGTEKQLFIDVSQIARSDYKTGIQRVVRSLVLQFFELGIKGFRVEPVWLVSSPGGWHYQYARGWTTRMLGYQETVLKDACIDPRNGDILLVADLTGGYFVEADRCGVYEQLEKVGISIAGIVYDILPIQMPDCFPAGTKETHEQWLRSISSRAKNLVCISKAVAEETKHWLDVNQPGKAKQQNVTWFHLGADLENSAPSVGIPSDIRHLQDVLAKHTSFLMVGTVEPRKGHRQAIEAFERLLSEGQPVCLLIVGKKGWMVEELAEKIRESDEFGKRIYWFESASDEFLEWLYQQSDCLLAASEGEGFGLPLIEAAVHGLPVLVRDIPVFREVAGTAANYFCATNGSQMADAIVEWCGLYKSGKQAKPENLRYRSWRESAMQLLEAINLRPE